MNDLKLKPFALIGINSWKHEADELRKVMVKENLNWRSFNGGESINRNWNQPATPTFYVIDHAGTIRRKWTGNPSAKTLDAALDKLIQEAEEAKLPR